MPRLSEDAGLLPLLFPVRREQLDLRRERETFNLKVEIHVAFSGDSSFFDPGDAQQSG